MKINLAVILLVSMAILSCGREHVAPPPADKYDNLSLVLFSAPWCHSCSDELKEVDRRISEFGSVYVSSLIVTGNSASQMPTDEAADKYKDELKIKLDVLPDYGRKLFSEHFTSISLPAAILRTTIEKCTDHGCEVEEKTVYKFVVGASVNDLISIVKGMKK